jgi:cell division control protein 7
MMAHACSTAHGVATNHTSCETVSAEDKRPEDSQATEHDEDMTEPEMVETEGQPLERDDDQDDDDTDGTCSDDDEEQTDGLTESAQPSEDEEKCPSSLLPEVEKVTSQFPEFSRNFKITGKIGEGTFCFPVSLIGVGTFSTVYKAIDLKYELFENSWDASWNDCRKWASPPIKRTDSQETNRPIKFVALKRIYVTSSPTRIFNELKLLHCLR